MRVLVLLLLGLGLTFAAFRNRSSVSDTGTCQPANEKELAEATADANDFVQILIQSTDGGNAWQDIRPMLPHPLNIQQIMADDKELFVAIDRDGLFRSDAPEKGQWKQEVGSQFFKKRYILDIYPGRIGHYVSTTEGGLYRKIVGTELWQTMHDSLRHRHVSGVLELAEGVILVSSGDDIVKSEDDGLSWKRVMVGEGIGQMCTSGKAIFATCMDGLLRSTDAGEHWEFIMKDGGQSYKTSLIQGGIAAIRNGDSWGALGQGQKLRISKDEGETWQNMDIGVMLSRISDIKQAGKYLFCAHNEGISRSADGGKNWELVYPYVIQNDQNYLSLEVKGNTVFAILMRGGC